MNYIDEVFSLFDEVEEACEYGRFMVVGTEDGVWFAETDKLDVDVMWKPANLNMKEALRKSQQTLEEELCEMDDNDRKVEQPGTYFNDTTSQNLDYFGTKEQYIETVFRGAFEPALGSDAPSFG